MLEQTNFFPGPKIFFLTDITHSWALADKLYNSVTGFFCASQKYVFHLGLTRELNVD